MAKARNRYRNDPKHDALARQAASIDAHRQRLKRAQGKQRDAADLLAAIAAQSHAAAQAMDRLAADTRAATARIKSMGARITAMAAATITPQDIRNALIALGVTEGNLAWDPFRGVNTLRGRTPGGAEFLTESYDLPRLLDQLRDVVAAEKLRMFSRMTAQSHAAAKLPKVEPVPKRTGKALGFRSWTLEGYKLQGVRSFSDWKAAEPTKAECVRWWPGIPPSHDAPHPNCECGLYALHAPEFMSRWHGDDPLMVHGAVLGWGRMQVHGEGWRAEYAQPVMLAYDGARQTYNHCERVKALGSELGLPVVPWVEFEREARKFGEPVPDELRPEGAVDGYASGGTVGSTGNTLALRPIVGARALKRCPHCLAVYTVWEGHCPSCGR